ncbi:MAG: cell division protein ZapA [Rhodospirillales bacterium]|nr:cell division protein ZapA [Rhodospirillales bacterium]
MAQVSLTVNGRRYDVSCDDGQEGHVEHLAAEVDARITRLAASVGAVGDTRLLLLTSLLLADEVGEKHKEIARLRGAREGAGPGSDGLGATIGAADVGGAHEALHQMLGGLAERIEALADQLCAIPAIAEDPQAS